MTREERRAEQQAYKEVMDSIYAIRRQVNKETKGMTLGERMDHVHAYVDEYCRIHGITLNYVDPRKESGVAQSTIAPSSRCV
jgi:hypothetical protein